MASPSVPKSWLPIVNEALQELEALGVRVDQAKEKFGELVVYVEPNLPPDIDAQVQALIATAAGRVLGICALCGAPSVVRSGPYAACEAHADYWGLQWCAWPRRADG